MCIENFSWTGKNKEIFSDDPKPNPTENVGLAKPLLIAKLLLTCVI